VWPCVWRCSFCLPAERITNPLVIPLYMRKLVVGCLLFMACGTPGNERPYSSQGAQAKTEEGVKSWIKKYALYPDSYKPLSFEEYTESYTSRSGEKVPGTENYIIKHTHQILDKDSNLATFSGYFFLDQDYSVNLIEVERSSALGGGFPPETRIWTSRFGRPLTVTDSVEFKEKALKKNKETLLWLKEALEHSEVYTDDPEAVEDLKKRLDTLK
jgi:hypothetical protein